MGVTLLNMLKKYSAKCYEQSKKKIIISLCIGTFSLVLRIMLFSSLFRTYNHYGETSHESYSKLQSFKYDSMMNNSIKYNVLEDTVIFLVEYLPMMTFLASIIVSTKNF
jgi:hypothetical protein